jgi:hypothetical protein
MSIDVNGGMPVLGFHVAKEVLECVWRFLIGPRIVQSIGARKVPLDAADGRVTEQARVVHRHITVGYREICFPCSPAHFTSIIVSRRITTLVSTTDSLLYYGPLHSTLWQVPVPGLTVHSNASR